MDISKLFVYLSCQTLTDNQMKKVFLVLALLSIFSVVNANSLETKTKILQIAKKQIIHENINYTEVFIYSDIQCTKLIKIITVDKNFKTVVIN